MISGDAHITFKWGNAAANFLGTSTSTFSAGFTISNEIVQLPR